MCQGRFPLSLGTSFGYSMRCLKIYYANPCRVGVGVPGCVVSSGQTHGEAPPDLENTHPQKFQPCREIQSCVGNLIWISTQLFETREARINIWIMLSTMVVHRIRPVPLSWIGIGQATRKKQVWIDCLSLIDGLYQSLMFGDIWMDFHRLGLIFNVMGKIRRKSIRRIETFSGPVRAVQAWLRPVLGCKRTTTSMPNGFVLFLSFSSMSFCSILVCALIRWGKSPGATSFRNMLKLSEKFWRSWARFALCLLQAEVNDFPEILSVSGLSWNQWKTLFQDLPPWPFLMALALRCEKGRLGPNVGNQRLREVGRHWPWPALLRHLQRQDGRVQDQSDHIRSSHSCLAIGLACSALLQSPRSHQYQTSRHSSFLFSIVFLHQTRPITPKQRTIQHVR